MRGGELLALDTLCCKNDKGSNGSKRLIYPSKNHENLSKAVALSLEKYTSIYTKMHKYTWNLRARSPD